ncbi:Hypothetical_protein [Hexamita inflata]|uniref:Hypothetical_protein n=1 Tax=Hexamita inflata TaxID=28002 RepID=A0AA86QHC4_9EUKA|nr:Hypothetical protein HINF_LOCUS46445 [Hexamita inflata]
MNYLKPQSVIEYCEENTDISFDEAVIYLDAKNKRQNKNNKYDPKSLNMKVLLIVLIQNNKVVKKLEITNNYIYTVKKIQEQIINESIIKIHIDHEASQFTSKAGEQHDFYQAQQFRVKPEEAKHFDLIRIQKEFNIVVLDKAIDFGEEDTKPEVKSKKPIKKQVKKEESEEESQ